MIVALKHAWKRLTASQTARLLVLEFAVVLSGVLVAQLLQDWFADRSEKRAAEAQLFGISAALHNSAELAIIRPRMDLCMRDAIEQVRDVLADPAADRTTLGWLEVPEQMVLDEAGIDSARPLLRRHYDNNVLMVLSSAQFMNHYMVTGQDDELAAWSQLKLLRPENGPISDDLRARMLLALSEAERTNRLLREVSGVMQGRAREMGIPVHQNTIDSMSNSPKLCTAMIAYDEEAHAAAAARGELPDGRALHPRVAALVRPAEPAE